MAGLHYEEFEVGQTFEHPIRRTVTEMDNLLFTALTHNPAPLHLDEEYCKNETEFGTRIVNSTFTLALMVGVTVYDTTLGTTSGNLGWEEVRFPRPVFPGDTLHFATEIKAKRESASRPQDGIVTFIHRAWNQKDELVAECTRVALMQKKKPGQAGGG